MPKQRKFRDDQIIRQRFLKIVFFLFSYVQKKLQLLYLICIPLFLIDIWCAFCKCFTVILFLNIVVPHTLQVFSQPSFECYGCFCHLLFYSSSEIAYRIHVQPVSRPRICVHVHILQKCCTFLGFVTFNPSCIRNDWLSPIHFLT